MKLKTCKLVSDIRLYVDKKLWQLTQSAICCVRQRFPYDNEMVKTENKVGQISFAKFMSGLIKKFKGQV